MRNPPIGIALLGFFGLMAGFAYLILGLQWIGAVAFGPVPSGQGVGITGLLAVLAGGIYLVAGVALWSLRAWAWAFAMILSVFGLFEAVLVMFSSNSLAAGLGAALFPAIVLWYLNTNDIKAAFIEANPPEPEAPPAAAAAAPAPAVAVAEPAAADPDVVAAVEVAQATPAASAAAAEPPPPPAADPAP